MERESFENREVSRLLNRYYVAVKVDREERPDVDQLYMNFCQFLTGAGGWPLTCILTPDREPIYIGTYFPKNNAYGRIGLMELLEQLARQWKAEESKLREYAGKLVEALRPLPDNGQRSPAVPRAVSEKFPSGDLPSTESKQRTALIGQAFADLSGMFDRRYGGFGKAPKFPSPHHLSFLLRCAALQKERTAWTMVQKTLDMMGSGGIYDHIGYGFSRYSTDEKWLIPHFEKMLYDNALLAIAYLESYQFAHREQDAQKAGEIFSYLLRDMQSPEGAFYSAEDADSEGKEGTFYLWTSEEIERILAGEEASLFKTAYHVTPEGNFAGKNILYRIDADWGKIALNQQIPLARLRQRLESAAQKLFVYRQKRVQPFRDDKILTGWNGLAIAALAKGALALNEKSYLEQAERALAFILSHLRNKDGRLFARFREGEAAHLAYLDDYAYLIWGILELYTAGGNPEHLKLALELQAEQDRLFRAEDTDDYFLSGSDGEELLLRSKSYYDGALPSGNSIAAMNLLRIARFTDAKEWRDKGERTLRSLSERAVPYPAGYTAFLQAVQYSLSAEQTLVLSGPLTDPNALKMRQVIGEKFDPFLTLIYQEGTVSSVLPWLKDYPFAPEKARAYLCQSRTCLPPISDPENLRDAISSGISL